MPGPSQCRWHSWPLWTTGRPCVRARDATLDEAARQLTEIARLADTDDLRNRVRAVAATGSKQERLRILKDLAVSARVAEWPAGSLDLLARSLLALDDPMAAEGVLRVAVRRFPADVWINYDLARSLEGSSRREEAIRYYTAAGALRPQTAHALADALASKGETEEAIGILQELARRQPEKRSHLVCLGAAMQSRGRAEAVPVLDGNDLRPCAPPSCGRPTIGRLVSNSPEP